MPQIMDKAARAQHQHIFRAQRRQRPAQRQMMGGAPGALHRQLHHRDIGVWVHQHQGHPGPMIQAARGVGLGGKTRRAQKLRHPRRQPGIARCGIADVVQRFGKAVKIVNRGVDCHRVDGRQIAVPMGRDRQDGAGRAEIASQAAQEFARRDSVERQGGRTMGNENRRQHLQQMALARGLFNGGPGRAGSGTTRSCPDAPTDNCGQWHPGRREMFRTPNAAAAGSG